MNLFHPPTVFEEKEAELHDSPRPLKLKLKPKYTENLPSQYRTQQHGEETMQDFADMPLSGDLGKKPFTFEKML